MNGQNFGSRNIKQFLFYYKSSENKVVGLHLRIVFYLSGVKKQVCCVQKVCSNWLRPVVLLKQWLSSPYWELQSSDCLLLADIWPPTLYLFVRRTRRERIAGANYYYLDMEIFVSFRALNFVYRYTTSILLLTIAHQSSCMVTPLLDGVSPHSGACLLLVCCQPPLVQPWDKREEKAYFFGLCLLLKRAGKLKEENPPVWFCLQLRIQALSLYYGEKSLQGQNQTPS